MFGFNFGGNCGYNYFWGFNFWNYSYKCDTECEPESVITAQSTHDDTVDDLTLVGDGSVTSNGGIEINHTSDGCDGDSTYAKAPDWNTDNYDTIDINNNDDSIYVENFNNVDITNNNKCGVDVDIVNAQSGEINTGCGRDNINIEVNHVYSWHYDWVNNFEIDSGGGRDTITLSGDESSHIQFGIDAGRGRDTVDISGVMEPCGDALERTADGGCGRDTLVISEGTENVEFANFEVIVGVGGECCGSMTSLAVGQEMLESNGSWLFGMVFSNIDLDLSGNQSVDVDCDLSWCETRYIEKLGFDSDDFASLTVDTGEGCYNILTDDLDCGCV